MEILNSANIVLLPKKAESLRITDFRPISLIHSIAKIFSKLLANRLAPHLNSLVSNCQSAFIKKRSIHDNFLYVQGAVRRMHKLHLPALFMKLDTKHLTLLIGAIFLKSFRLWSFGRVGANGFPSCSAQPPPAHCSMDKGVPPSTMREASTRVTPSPPCFLSWPWTPFNACLTWRPTKES